MLREEDGRAVRRPAINTGQMPNIWAYPICEDRVWNAEKIDED